MKARDLNKYQGIFPAFYACYDDAGEVSPARARAFAAASLAQSWQNKIVPGIPGTQFPFLFVCRGFFVPFD